LGWAPESPPPRSTAKAEVVVAAAVVVPGTGAAATVEALKARQRAVARRARAEANIMVSIVGVDNV